VIVRRARSDPDEEVQEIMRYDSMDLPGVIVPDLDAAVERFIRGIERGSRLVARLRGGTVGVTRPSVRS